MGTHAAITSSGFPKQGKWVGRRVKVCFHYDTSQVVEGEIVRDDAEDPHRTIIKLDDGRHVLGVECQYQPI